ncbi:type VII toxin-antitoxin system HepT family RNase toxin (plasmid) [Niallia taxi]|uniref:type VII toxin-antitoxin system HepT family RNase toxin n=1 Tax=Niallia taxi TaxID=2499688 RepID=UPI003F61D4AF
MKSDVILNKVAIIERCIRRINEEYQQNPQNLENNTKQDSIILNLQRACEASIYLAMHIVADKRLGLPQDSRDAFSLLEAENIIPAFLSNRMKAMVGFRNIAVHDYQELNLVILQKILDHHLVDFSEYTQTIIHFK